MTDITEREKMQHVMDFLNTGVQFAPDIAMILQDTVAIYKCGCRGEVYCTPNTKKRTMTLTLYCFCQNCKKCSAFPTKLIIYKTESEFNPMSKKKVSQNPTYGAEISYKQFEKYYELN